MAIVADSSLPIAVSIERASPAESTLVETTIGRDIVKTYLSELAETTLTRVILTTSTFDDDLESSLWLPISEIERGSQLKMDELFAATREEGEWSDSFHGFKHFDE